MASNSSFRTSDDGVASPSSLIRFRNSLLLNIVFNIQAVIVIVVSETVTVNLGDREVIHGLACEGSEALRTRAWCRSMTQRYGQIIGVKPECIDAYERIHAQAWPEVLATIRACNIRNYSIFRHNTTLFAYFEYTGDDFAADMAKMAEDPKTREWWTQTDPMQVPLPERSSSEWWLTLKEVFHTD